MTAKKDEKPADLTAEERQDAAERERLDALEHDALMAEPIGAVRPADSVEARLDRLEVAVRSHVGAALPGPERAVDAAKVQDKAAADAAKAAKQEEAK